MNFLFDRLGGSRAIEAVVTAFYQRVLGDPRLAPIFSGIDTAQLIQHQRRFLVHATGGSRRYHGRSLAAAHADVVARHGIGHSHFDAVLEHLGEAMLALDVAPPLVREVLALADSVRADVLGLDPARAPGLALAAG
jgi:hemoglobin